MIDITFTTSEWYMVNYEVLHWHNKDGFRHLYVYSYFNEPYIGRPSKSCWRNKTLWEFDKIMEDGSAREMIVMG